jgi:hypothetical protein
VGLEATVGRHDDLLDMSAWSPDGTDRHPPVAVHLLGREHPHQVRLDLGQVGDGKSPQVSQGGVQSLTGDQAAGEQDGAERDAHLMVLPQRCRQVGFPQCPALDEELAEAHRRVLTRGGRRLCRLQHQATGHVPSSAETEPS